MRYIDRQSIQRGSNHCNQSIAIEIAIKNIFITWSKHLIDRHPSGLLGNRAISVNTPNLESTIKLTDSLHKHLEDYFGRNCVYYIPADESLAEKCTTFPITQRHFLTIFKEFLDTWSFYRHIHRMIRFNTPWHKPVLKIERGKSAVRRTNTKKLILARHTSAAIPFHPTCLLADRLYKRSSQSNT